MFDTLHGIVDSVGSAVGEGGINLGGNVLLDPANDMRRQITDIFTAILEVFSFFRLFLETA